MLTPRAKDTLKFIEKFIQENEHAPTLEEIGEGIGVNSIGSVRHHVNNLVEHNYLQRIDKQSRGLRLTKIAETSGTPLVLKMLGKIAAGRLIEAVPDESEVDVGGMFSGKDRYVLKVTGDSMTGKGIMSGDYVVLDTKRQPRHGDVIVALIDGYDATLKTMLLNEDKTITLMPANEAFAPIIIEAHRLSIQGVVVGQMRTYP